MPEIVDCPHGGQKHDFSNSLSHGNSCFKQEKKRGDLNFRRTARPRPHLLSWKEESRIGDERSNQKIVMLDSSIRLA
jgi:hypothetical protein